MANEITPQLVRNIKQASPDELINMNQDVIETKAVLDNVNEEMLMLSESIKALNETIDVYEIRKRRCRNQMHKIAMRLA